jgi:hypothetical protein
MMVGGELFARGKSMAEAAQLIWAPEAPPCTFQCELFFDPALGLVDIDFHPVTQAGWEHLKSVHPGDAARLTVPPHVPISKVQEALADIRTKGGYATVVVTVGAP